MKISDPLRSLVNATSRDTVARVRIAVGDAAEQGTISKAAATAIDAVARLVAESLPEVPEPEAEAVPEAPAGRPARELVPEGVQSLEIVAAEIRPVEWKRSTDNPTGECLSLRLRQGERATVFADVPLDWKGAMRAVEASVGCGRDDLAGMVGRSVTVEIGHHAGRNGRRAVVKKWVPAVASAAATAGVEPKAAKAAGTPRAARGKPAWADEADVPF